MNALIVSPALASRAAPHPQRSNHPLQGALAVVTRDGADCARREHKPTADGNVRIWFFVKAQMVHLEQVHSYHPNATK